MKVFPWMTVLWIAGHTIAQVNATPPFPAVLQTSDVTITGRITVDEGVPIPLPAISFLQAGRTIRVATIERDGRFQLKLPQGDYTVTVSSLPNGYFLRYLRHGSVDLLTSPLKLSGGLQELQVAVGLNSPASWVRVSGRVLGFDTLPTFGTNSVVLQRSANIQPLRAPIRMDGRFEFQSVLPGSYNVRVVDAGESAIVGVLPVAVQVAAGSDVTGLVLTVQALVPVTGRIQLEGQVPLPYVSLFFAGSDGRSFSTNIGTTDGFLKAKVLPGEYRVRVLNLSAGYTVSAVTMDSVDVLSTTLRVEPATPLELAVKIQSSVKAVKVSGRVVRTSDAEPAPSRISLSTPLPSILANLTNGILSPRALATVVRSDGSFEFPTVIPGSYQIDVELDSKARGDYQTGMLHEPQTLLVGEAGATGIEVRVPRHFQMLGRIVVEDGGPMPRPSLDIEYVTTPPSTKSRLGGLIPDPDGTFGIVLPEGAYRFSVRELPPGYFVKSMFQAGRDALNQPFLLSADSRQLAVVIGTTSPQRKVRGRVVDAPNPGSTSSVSVKLITGITEIETTVGPGGRFEFPKVPPGVYNVVVSGSMAEAQVSIGDGPPGQARITVAEKDIEDLRIRSNTAVRSFLGRGRVVVEGGGPMPRFGLTFNGGGGSIVPSPIDGTFQTWMNVGSSKVAISALPMEYVLKAVTFDGANLLEKELELHDTDVNTNLLRIVVEPSGIPWKSVAGRLAGFENLGKEPVRLILSSLNQNIDVPVASDGSFEIPQALSGTYNSFLQIGNPGTRAGLRAQIVVADENITALELASPRPLTVSISADGGTSPVEPLHLAVARRDSENRWLDNFELGNTSLGYFIAGDRLQISRVPFGYRVKSVLLGSVDLLQDPVRFDDALPSQVSIVLESTPRDPLKPEFTLKGRVQSPTTNPARRRVTATYVGYGRETVVGTMMETFVRDDGSFQFDRLPAGPFEIRIADRPEVSRFILPDESGSGVILSIP